MYRVQELVRLHRMDEAKGEVARLVGISPTTERTYREVLCEAGLLDGDPSDLPSEAELRSVLAKRLGRRVPPQQASSIASWEDEVLALVKDGNGAKAIHEFLKTKAAREEREFGSYYAVKRMVRRLKRGLKPSPDDVSIPVLTGPGEVAQVDFGYVGRVLDPASGKVRRAWVFVMVLGFSRHMFARVVFDQRAETWLRLHVEAFEALGGAVETVVPDNLKSAVIRAAFGKTDRPELNRSYCELARHYGFKIDPTPPRSPEKKGKVESGVKYVRSSFVRPRRRELAATPVDALNEQLDAWVADTAGLREHGTTRRQPRIAFETSERAALRPLPRLRYVIAIWSRHEVLTDSHVRVGKAFYSVPYEHLGKEVSVRASERSVEVYLDASRVATHARVEPGEWSTVEAHLPAERVAYRHRSESYWRERGAALGEECGLWVAELLEGDPVLSRVREAQRAVLLLEGVGPERAEAACRRARHYDNHAVRALREILAKGLEARPLGDEDEYEAEETAGRGAGPGATSGAAEPPRFARTPAEIASWASTPRTCSRAVAGGAR